MLTYEEKKKAAEEGTFIFNSVYPCNITEKQFFHKHFNNPSCTQTPFMFTYTENVPVIMHWMMGMEFLHNSQKYNAVQGSDDAALPEARGSGLFIKVIKASEEIMINNGTDFVYGCYYPGHAMNIADKFGIKNIVNLYTAKLPLSETTYRWKRFDIHIPKYFIKLRTTKRIKKLQKLASLCDNKITVSNECPFSKQDYEIINSDSKLRVSRSKNYYDWKLGLFDKTKIKYITARKSGILTGFMILNSDEKEDVIVDWDILTEKEEKSNILSAMILNAYDKRSILVPSLNPTNNEMSLFTSIGFDDVRLHTAPICICAKVYSEELNDIICNPGNWKHRIIDTDYFLN